MSLSSKAAKLQRNIHSLGFMQSHRQLAVSQFAEDVVLEQLLRPQCSGTYVDVGANHPLDDSNTFSLYSRGWSGLAIDPNPLLRAEFRRYRPHDIFIAEGVSGQPAQLTYHQFAFDKFNTFSDARAAELIAGGEKEIATIAIPCRPLSEIVGEHLGSRPIDLLNIDCEGLDLEVFESLDVTVNRPMVVIMEDWQRFTSFRDGGEEGALSLLLRRVGYAPIAQMAWSTIYLARDWRSLIDRSGAFKREYLHDNFLP